MNHKIHHLLLLIIFIISANTLLSQESSNDTSYWHPEGDFDLSFSQVGLNNWSGGGQSSITVAGFFEARWDYEKEKNQWNNSISLGYGLIRQRELSEEFRKSDDELSLTSNYTRRLTRNWRLSMLLDLKSQMAPGYVYQKTQDNAEKRNRTSNFFAPAYLVTSAGFEFQPGKEFALLISPLSGKTTFVLDRKISREARYGVDSGQKVRQELGINLNTKIRWKVFKNVDFKSTLNLFDGYADLLKVDVNWQTQLLLKVNRFLSTTVSTNLVYDEDIDILRDDGTTGPAVQFKEVVGVGIHIEF